MKENFKMPYPESGITLNFPDENYFCFENCRGYQELSGFHFKEMDACWFDVNSKELYIIELEDFTQLTEQNEKLETKIDRLTRKTSDAILMLHSILFKTIFSEKIIACFPNNFNLEDFKFKFVHIIILEDEKVIILNDLFNNKIKAYQKLFNYDIRMITYKKAKEKFPNFVQ